MKASILWVERGTVSGVAPRAHVIIYKVGHAFVFDSDSIAAVQQAILDGVDVEQLTTHESYGRTLVDELR